jgi:hypothetical protein
VTSVVLCGDGHEIVICAGHEIVAGDGHMKSVGFSATRITSFPEVVWRIDSKDIRVPHEVRGIPVSVMRVFHPPDVGEDELDAEDAAVVEQVLVEVLAGGAEADRLGFVLTTVRSLDPSRPRHCAPDHGDTPARRSMLRSVTKKRRKSA